MEIGYHVTHDNPAVQTDLSGEDEIRKHEHGGAISHKVRDGLHDIPGVLPPGQPSKESELQGHPCHATPHPQVGAREGSLLQSFSLRFQRHQISSQLLQLPLQLKLLGKLGN